MPRLRSATNTLGRNIAGARALWRANGMEGTQFGKPIIAIANSFTQFVPGHAHLHDIGQKVKSIIEKSGCFAAEFNTIAVDDGIAMGHSGMLYSLPSREIIADSVEYMANTHCTDALICISNCDKITPGMLMASMRLNISSIFISGGPMKAGRVGNKKYDLVDVMVMGPDLKVSDEELAIVEENACPTCVSCSGMFTENSMNCLNEALGLALPGNGTVVATHAERLNLFERAARRITELAEDFYKNDNYSVLPRSIASKAAFLNAMSLDIAMGGSTNTVLHLLAIAKEAEVDFTMADIDRISRKVPCICKVSPNSDYHIEDVHRAGGIMGILSELDRGGLLDTSVSRVDSPSLAKTLEQYSITKKSPDECNIEFYKAAPEGVKNLKMGSQKSRFVELDTDRSNGCIRDVPNAYYPDGGFAVLSGNLAKNGCIVKTAGVDKSILRFRGPAVVFESKDDAIEGILGGKIKAGDVVIIRYEGPKGGPGMQEMLYPTSYLKSMKLGNACALITDGRFSGGASGLSIGHVSPEAAAGGEIALAEDGDSILIDIPKRKIELEVSNDELQLRKTKQEKRGANAFKPAKFIRVVSRALQMYALHTTSADQEAVRRLPHEK